MTTAYEDVTTDAWAAIVIGAVELVVLAMIGIATVMRWRRSRHDVTALSQAPQPAGNRITRTAFRIGGVTT